MAQVRTSVALQGLVVAASAPALFAAVAYGRADLTAVFAIWSVAHAMFLGLPLFLLLRSRGQVGWLSSAVCGALVGALPLGLLLFPGWPQASTATVWVNEQVMSVNGVATAAAWLSYGLLVAKLAALGTVCGLLFFAFVGWRGQNAT
jgi:hypothetical protein